MKKIFLLLSAILVLFISCNTDNTECSECHHLLYYGSTLVDTLETNIYCNEKPDFDTTYIFIAHDFWSCEQ